MSGHRLRIALVSHEWPAIDQYTGGIGTHFAALAEGLSGAAHDVHVFTSGPQRTVVRSNGITMHTSPPTSRFGARTFEFALRGPRYVRALEGAGVFDVVIVPEYGAWAWPLTLRKRRPIVVVSLATSSQQIDAIESVPRKGLVRQLQRRLQYRLERRQAEHADALVPISNAIDRWARSIWDLDSIPSFPIPNVVDPTELDSASVARADGRVVLFVGRVCGWKGADVAINAMARYWEHGGDARLYMAGRVEGIDGQPLDRFVDEHVPVGHRDKLRMLGHLNRSELLSLMSGADLAVFPSRFEGFGIAALEAKYLARPVIVTKGSGFDDFCSDGRDCLMIRPGDADELCAAISALLSNEDRRRELGAAAAASARSYTAEIAAARLLQVIQSVSPIR